MLGRALLVSVSPVGLHSFGHFQPFFVAHGLSPAPLRIWIWWDTLDPGDRAIDVLQLAAQFAEGVVQV